MDPEEDIPQKPGKETKEFIDFESLYTTESEPETRIIKDPRVFSIHYLPQPDEILPRPAEINKLRSIFMDFINGTRRVTKIHGMIGAGKTLFAKTVMNESLKQLIDKQQLPLRICYVDCGYNTTKTGVLYSILTEISDRKIPRSGWSSDTYTHVLNEELEKLKGLLLILDDFDRTLDRDGEDLLHTLLDEEKISLLLISDNLEWIDEMRGAVTLRVGEEILFRAYDKKQVGSILRKRAASGLYEGTWDDELPGKIVEQANQNIRIGMDILRLSARYAEEKRKEEVDAECIIMILDEIKSDIKIDLIKTLPKQYQSIITSTYELHNKLSRPPYINEIYDNYADLMDSEENPRKLTKASVKKYVYDLVGYALLSASERRGMGRGKGRERAEISPEFDTELFKKEFIKPEADKAEE